MYTETTFEQSGIVGALLVGILFLGFIGIIFYILTALAVRKILTLQGETNVNRAWIPIYNNYLYMRAGGQPEWLLWVLIGTIVISVIPIVNFLAFIGSVTIMIFSIIATINLAKGFQKNPVLYALLYFFVAPITMIMFLVNNNPWNPNFTPVGMNPPNTPQGSSSPMSPQSPRNSGTSLNNPPQQW